MSEAKPWSDLTLYGPAYQDFPDDYPKEMYDREEADATYSALRAEIERLKPDAEIGRRYLAATVNGYDAHEWRLFVEFVAPHRAALQAAADGVEGE